MNHRKRFSIVRLFLETWHLVVYCAYVYVVLVQDFLDLVYGDCVVVVVVGFCEDVVGFVWGYVWVYYL